MTLKTATFLFVMLLAGLAAANLSDLNSIFLGGEHHHLPNAKSCDKKSAEPAERHTVVDNLDKALSVGLNKTFQDKFECMQRIFDQKLVDMQHFYKLKLKEAPKPNVAVQPKPDKAKKDKKKKEKKEDDEPKSDLLVGQTGFIFYSLNQNGSLADFKHESFRFVRPTNANNSNGSDGGATLLEKEIEAFSADLVALKAVVGNVKRNVKVRVNLLKAIRANERELETAESDDDEALVASETTTSGVHQLLDEFLGEGKKVKVVKSERSKRGDEKAKKGGKKAKMSCKKAKASKAKKGGEEVTKSDKKKSDKKE